MQRLRSLFLLLLFVVVCAGAWALLRGGAPRIQPDAAGTAVGAHKMLGFTIQGPAGVSRVRAWYMQQGREIPLGSQIVGPRRWFTSGGTPAIVHFTVQAGRAAHPELRDGAAQLLVEAAAANLRGSTTLWRRDVTVRSTPPQVAALSGQHYLEQGGSELVVYQLTTSLPADEVQSGVEMAGTFFPGYPVPGAPAPTAGIGQNRSREMFALLAFPYNAPADSQPHLVARDDAGNEASAGFWVKLTPRAFRQRTLDIDDAYIQRVVVPIIQQTPSLHDPGDPLQEFLLVNRQLRQTDTQELVAAAKQTAPGFLWHGAFTQLHDSQVEAEFADHRLYRYRGRIVDQEDHLGYDLAAVRHTPVLAANSGRVVWARYFGIYGNSVLIDHGYGLMSLYAHLNDFQVKAGDDVRAGQLIAHSDSTGLAGGDHLHFSMLLDGVQVDPKQWWDAHWIHDRIESQLPGVFAAPAAPTPPTR